MCQTKPPFWAVFLDNVDDLFLESLAVEVSLALVAKLHLAILEGEECMVLAYADVLTWEDISAALAHDNSADLCDLAVVELRSEILWITISAVFCCTARLFCCHNAV